jgi:hypothetical protein
MVAEVSGTVGAALLAASGTGDSVAAIADVPFPPVVGRSRATVAGFSVVEHLIDLLSVKASTQ